MSISPNKLNEYITLYLNDVEDYSDEKTFVLAESILKPLKKVLIESDQGVYSLLLEMLRKAPPASKEIIEDFLLYVKEQ